VKGKVGSPCAEDLREVLALVREQVLLVLG